MKTRDRSVTTRYRINIIRLVNGNEPLVRRETAELRRGPPSDTTNTAFRGAYVSMKTMGTIGCSNNNNDITMTRRM
jgi:hypothetical protein